MYALVFIIGFLQSSIIKVDEVTGHMKEGIGRKLRTQCTAVGYLLS